MGACLCDGELVTLDERGAVVGTRRDEWLKKGHRVVCAQFQSNGSLLVALEHHGEVRLELRRLGTDAPFVSLVVQHPSALARADDGTLVYATEDEIVLRAGAPDELRIPRPAGSVQLAISGDGRWLGTVHDVVDGRTIGDLCPGEGRVYRVADGALVARILLAPRGAAVLTPAGAHVGTVPEGMVVRVDGTLVQPAPTTPFHRLGTRR